MKERPILFSGPMVRALLAGTKTQTRRVVKSHRNSGDFIIADGMAGALLPYHSIDGETMDATGNNEEISISCPYGQHGDRLWVRETWDFRPWATFHDKRSVIVAYGAGGQSEEIEVPRTWNPTLYNYERWRPSIHMPRWASRINLEVTSVRVERLQDISEADARAEGIVSAHGGFMCGYTMPDVGPGLVGRVHSTAKSAYRELFQGINSPHSWDANPWVWVVEFKPLPQSNIGTGVRND